ncbi:MAG: permease [Halothermotrichaceae bacterium]
MIYVLERILKAEIAYLQADWWILSLAIITAAGIKVYVGQEKIKVWMEGKSYLSITGSVGFGAFTPLCSCGTMAVIISMFVTSLPWGPVMGFNPYLLENLTNIDVDINYFDIKLITTGNRPFLWSIPIFIIFRKYLLKKYDCPIKFIVI